MNPLGLLQIPWYSTHRSLRWITVALLIVCTVTAVLIGRFTRSPGDAEVMLGFGLFFLWAFFLSTPLLLAIDTRQLRVPGIQRGIVASLIAYGLLSIVLPTGLLMLLGASAPRATMTLALFCVSGFVFAMMPRYVAVSLGLMPSLFNSLWYRLHLPALGDPRLNPWFVTATIVLLVFVVWCWRHWLMKGAGQSQGWTSPMVLQFRNSSWGHWTNIGEQRQLRQRPDWLQLAVDLDKVGPTQPRNSLRVAFGGWYLPQTKGSYAKQFGLLLGMIALPVLGVILVSELGHPDHAVARVIEVTLLGSLGGCAIFGGPMIALLSQAWICKRWKRVNAELPLLALLPSLGAGAPIKRHLLRTGLGLPLTLHAMLIVSVGLVMLGWSSHLAMLLFVLLAQLGSAAVTCALLLNLFGGRRLAVWAMGLLLAICFAMTMLSLMLPLMTWGSHPVAWSGALLAPLAGAWLLLGAAMSWLCRRGWRSLQQLPHPFLQA